MLPDFLTHRTRGTPFRSMTAAEPRAWPAIVAGLDSRAIRGIERFEDPHYLPRRRAVEERLHAGLVARGGRPTRNHPSYWLLGRSTRALRTGEVEFVLPLTPALEPVLTFTIGDSLLALDPDYRAQVELPARAGEVFCLSRLAAISAELGEDGWKTLEAQLWADPVAWGALSSRVAGG